MRARLSIATTLLGTALALPLIFFAGDQPSTAADHFDPPSRVQVGSAANPDIPADMADFYISDLPNGNVLISYDFGGPRPANESAKYDRNVVFQMLLSNDATTSTPEFTIEWRFGQDPANPNANGIRITGLPGNPNPIIIPCETIFTTPNGIKIYAGLIDDPFNFDPVGLTETRQTSRLSIRSDRNRFATENSTAVVFEMPRSVIVNGTNPIAGWGFSYRFPGSPIAS